MEVTITVNSKSETVNQCSIREFVVNKGLVPEVVVIEYNGNILKREKWNETMLSEGDKLEIVSFVGGG